jgi:methionyl-tRNA synthetase
LAAVALHPFMPVATQEIWRQLGESVPLADAGRTILREGRVSFADGQTVTKGAPLFPRKE